MTATAEIMKLIDNTHCMDRDGLRVYHTAKRVRDCKRIKTSWLRLGEIRKALKNYRVVVTLDYGKDAVRVFRPDTQQEMFF